MNTYYYLLGFLYIFVLLPIGTLSDCDSKTTCGDCTKSASCVWCHVGTTPPYYNNSYDICLKGGPDGQSDPSLECDYFYWVQCKGSSNWTGNDYSYIISIVVIAVIIIIIVISVTTIILYCHRRYLPSLRDKRAQEKNKKKKKAKEKEEQEKIAQKNRLRPAQSSVMPLHPEDDELHRTLMRKCLDGSMTPSSSIRSTASSIPFEMNSVNKDPESPKSQPQTLRSEPQTLRSQPTTLRSQPQTLRSQPQTPPHSQPVTPRSQPQTPRIDPEPKPEPEPAQLEDNYEEEPTENIDVVAENNLIADDLEEVLREIEQHIHKKK